MSGETCKVPTKRPLVRIRREVEVFERSETEVPGVREDERRKDKEGSGVSVSSCHRSMRPSVQWTH